MLVQRLLPLPASWHLQPPAPFPCETCAVSQQYTVTVLHRQQAFAVVWEGEW